jgi:hypothetical protein
MTRGVAHSPELRARVVAAVLAGATIPDVAAQFNLDQSLVWRWVQTPSLQPIARQKTETDTDLVMRYFRTAIRAMITQAEVFGDEQYCRAQDADKLAIAHGVLGDKFAGIATTAASLGLIGPSPGTLDGTVADRTAVGLPELPEAP